MLALRGRNESGAAAAETIFDYPFYGGRQIGRKKYG
jgi:hypothetical protein